MARREKQLIACHPAHRFRMPSPQRGTPHVHRTGVGNIAARDALSGAAQPEIRIFELRFEGLLQQAYLAKNFGAV